MKKFFFIFLACINFIYAYNYQSFTTDEIRNFDSSRLQKIKIYFDIVYIRNAFAVSNIYGALIDRTNNEYNHRKKF